MLLASVEAIRTQLGFDDMTDINEAIKFALHSAEAQLSSALMTDFDRATVTDTFYVDEPSFQQGAHAHTEFRLSRGLVKEVLSARLVTTPLQFGSSQDEIDTLGRLELHRDKGVIIDYQSRYRRQYIRFTYTCGYEVSESDPESYENVPSWLREAAKVQAVMLLANAAPVTEAAIQIDKTMLEGQLSAMLRNKIRYTPCALLPIGG